MRVPPQPFPELLLAKSGASLGRPLWDLDLYLVVAQNKPQHRSKNIVILTIGTLKRYPEFGKPPFGGGHAFCEYKCKASQNSKNDLIDIHTLHQTTNLVAIR